MKKLLTLLLLLVLLTGCTNNVAQDEEIPDFTIDGTSGILNFSLKYTENERLLKTPSPDELPEGYWEYDDNNEFKPFNLDGLTSIDYFPTEYTFMEIEAAYEGDIPEEAYTAACEWVSCLFEATRLKNSGRMLTNIKDRYRLLTPRCKEFCESGVANTHVNQMYSQQDIRYMSLGYFSDNRKFSFRGYKTYYADLLNQQFYGIVVNVTLDRQYYSAIKSVPKFISDNDMPLSFYVELIFDKDNLIDGWRIQYVPFSIKEPPIKCYMISPTWVGNIDRPSYFEITPDDNSFKEVEIGAWFKYQNEAIGSLHRLLTFLKNTDDLNEDKFEEIQDIFSTKLSETDEMKRFFNEYVTDIEKYNVNFDFDPLTMQKLSVNRSTNMFDLYKDTVYGDVYSYTLTGLVETCSQQFNDKYGLRGDRCNFSAQFYFVLEDGKPKVVAIKMLNDREIEAEQFFKEQYEMQWLGQTPPPEEQG